MATLISGIYLMLEGTESEIDSLQYPREITWSTEYNAFRYKDDNNNIHHIKEHPLFNDLSDVDMMSPASGDITIFNGVNWISVDAGSITDELWKQNNDILQPITDPQRIEIGILSGNFDAKVMIGDNNIVNHSGNITITGTSTPDVNGEYVEIDVDHWYNGTYYIASGTGSYNEVYVITTSSNLHVDYWESSVVFYTTLGPLGTYQAINGSTGTVNGVYSTGADNNKYSLKTMGHIKSNKNIYALDSFISNNKAVFTYDDNLQTALIEVVDNDSDKMFTFRSDGTEELIISNNGTVDAVNCTVDDITNHPSGTILTTRDYVDSVSNGGFNYENVFSNPMELQTLISSGVQVLYFDSAAGETPDFAGTITIPQGNDIWIECMNNGLSYAFTADSDIEFLWDGTNAGNLYIDELVLHNNASLLIDPKLTSSNGLAVTINTFRYNNDCGLTADGANVYTSKLINDGISTLTLSSNTILIYEELIGDAPISGMLINDWWKTPVNNSDTGQLIKVTENGKTGYTLKDDDRGNKNDIGVDAIDFSATSVSGDYGAVGDNSFALGYNTLASGLYGYAEGSYTKAMGETSHAEGYTTLAGGDNSHAEGFGTVASGYASYAGNYQTIAGDLAHAEGEGSQALGQGSHAEGLDSIAFGMHSHAEGEGTQSLGEGSHSEGIETLAEGLGSHAEGVDSVAYDEASHAEGHLTIASGMHSHVEGERTIAYGYNSHAEGEGTMASGYMSHAEGEATAAYGNASHAEGNETMASGMYSHAEGVLTKSIGESSHAEGNYTISSGLYSHSEGHITLAKGNYSHAEGVGTIATCDASHAGGKYNVVDSNAIFQIGVGFNDTNRLDAINVSCSGIVKLPQQNGNITHDDDIITKKYLDNLASHAGQLIKLYEGGSLGYGLNDDNRDYKQDIGTHAIDLSYASTSGNYGSVGDYSLTTGYQTYAEQFCAHAEGAYSIAIGSAAHAEGHSCIASGVHTHAEGSYTKALNDYSHSEGYQTETYGKRSHAEGYRSKAYGETSHAEGEETEAVGTASHTEGLRTRAEMEYTHAEGIDTTAFARYSHAEGYNTAANGEYSHAEGEDTVAGFTGSHAEGISTIAHSVGSHAEGYYSEAIGDHSHAEGYSTKSYGISSHSIGDSTIARRDASFSAGLFNVDNADMIFQVGVGDDDANRLDAFNINFSGIAKLPQQNGHITEDDDIVTKKYVDDISTSDAGQLVSTIEYGLGYHLRGDDRSGKTSLGYHSIDFSHTYDTNDEFGAGIDYSVAFGSDVKAIGEGAFVAGVSNSATNDYAVSFGNANTSSAIYSFTAGWRNQARGEAAVAFGYESQARGQHSFAVGNGAYADGTRSVAMGMYTQAKTVNTMAIGDSTIADAEASFAQGQSTHTTGFASHAEGQSTQAKGHAAHSEGLGSIANGDYSHAGGYYTIASANNSTAIGSFNIEDPNAIFQVGIGTGSLNKKDALNINISGVAKLPQQNGNITDDDHIATKKYVDDNSSSSSFLGGTTAEMPKGSQTEFVMYFNTDLGYPIWFDISKDYWVNSTGAYVLPVQS